MQSLFRRTETRIHSTAEEQMQKKKGWADAGRIMACLQLGTQLLLWIFFDGYDRSAQTVWQAVLMLALPLTALWAVWRSADISLRAARWFLLPLVLCLAADAATMLSVMKGFLHQLAPSYPAWTGAAAAAAFAYLTALCARARGVRYGVKVLAVPLTVLLLAGTVLMRASKRADWLWPILGDGLLSTAKNALPGCGAVWGAALLFILPDKNRGGKTAGWLALPWALCVLCALWLGFLRPWAPGDELPAAEKMMGLARHAHSVLMYEMVGVMWMLLVPSSLIACLCTGGELLRRAFPQLGPWLSLLPVISVAAAAVFVPNGPALVGMALPWRWPVSLLCGLALLIHTRRKT